MIWIVSFHNPYNVINGSDITPFDLSDPTVDNTLPNHYPLIRHCDQIVATSLKHKFVATMRNAKCVSKSSLRQCDVHVHRHGHG
ncbi:hypothetical protein F511_20735 [Dorcoceras hygrometricum]|uniref:Uncharacterized protein n=1 Tax=Dorcoceras hygrometricum TaxID=472368 RepID=A0A2Z7AVH3_9LAMI|nr:hypothetical protein F511_20735 [Dorcoceras hygrometricum]